ncbi:type I DNA topoisomerase [Porphyromonadaceae bacterium]
MQKNLVIVESPAKAKTIEKFLGSEYKVMSSFGHIRDLKKKEFSVDIENNFTPIYEVSPEKQKVVAELKKEASQAETVWLASDEDREGEAIAWHLAETLKLTPENTRRIVFHEITKPAILEAVANPRTVNFNLVDAQQARRVLDRIVGFKLSPILWKRIKSGLSAGRVQSVTVRLVVEREREINQFNTESAYRVIALFSFPDENGNSVQLKAELNKRFKTKEEAFSFLNHSMHSQFGVVDIETKPTKRSPAAPFTTSTLQQEASRKLGFSVAQTMSVAQKLYESGKITYMRTDSTNLSKLALASAKEEIISLMGDEYVKIRNYQTKSKGAQEAHEAIRPTYMNNREIAGTAQEKKLYDLIWKRTLASQMADAQLEKTTITIDVKGRQEQFTAVGEVIKFDGFLRVYKESFDDDQEGDNESTLLPPIAIGQPLSLVEMTATERFTQRPPRYTEASLVRKLEELGIGRPSTYAPTISTIQQRGYVEKGEKEGEIRHYNMLTLKKGAIADQTKSEKVGAEKAKLFPTDIGSVVTDFLVENFPSIMDYNFTADVEEKFDHIAEGAIQWTDQMKEFYDVFNPIVESVSNAKRENKVGERQLGVDPKSGNPVSVKIGRFGPVVQIGSNDSEEKPRFASLLKNQSIETITLDEALHLFDLPKQIGTFEEKTVVVNVGRFGPYVSHDGKFVSIPKEIDPHTISLEEATELINEKRKAESQKLIKSFTEEPELEILNGRFGPYIAYKGKNFKIPRTQKPAELTLEQCMELINSADNGKKTEKKKAAPRKKKV